MSQSEKKRVAILATDGFEQVELAVPRAALKSAGAHVDIISLRPGKIRGMHHQSPGSKVGVDWTLDEAQPEDYDALVLPGGLISPDALRREEQALDFVRAFDRAGKPIAVICHGPWLLISAGLVRGRRLTSWPAIKDDVKNAGGVWEDVPVVREKNWVSSQGPDDLPKFVEGMLNLFGLRQSSASFVRVAMPWILGTAAIGAVAYLAQKKIRGAMDSAETPEPNEEL
jgi:protease I